MRTYAIVNRKGGVGKTTTAIELAFILATSCGQRVLLCDMDSQGNATEVLMPRHEGVAGMAEALRYDLEYYPDVIHGTEINGLDIIPATEALGDFELECTIGRTTPDFSRIRNLVECIAGDGEYDAVVFDCPPYYSISCISALAACDSIIIPAGVDAYSTVGMNDLVRQIENIRQACPRVKVAGVLVTQWRNSDIAHDAVETLRSDSPVPVFRTVIRRSDKAVESSWSRMAVGQLSPWSAAARDYRAWVAELLAKEDEGK